MELASKSQLALLNDNAYQSIKSAIAALEQQQQLLLETEEHANKVGLR